MRTHLRFAAASVAAASLVVTAAGATAAPTTTDPATAVAAPSGSSAVDTGSAAVESLGVLAGQGNIIGILGVLVTLPLNIVTTGICGVISGSAIPNNCTGLY
ncbi:hypothetical protein ACWEKT_36555 [Nocardia takedensis]|uniref:hypothetical protein n=1 Tax=Nocardia takedensis TaxID=259390 RepID=UPI0002FA8369|nr:hypothetical protein [Nocardia takedensis]